MQNFYSYDEMLEEFNKVSPDRVNNLFESMFDKKTSLESFLEKHADIDSYLKAQEIIKRLPKTFKPTKPILLALIVIFGALQAGKSYAQKSYIGKAKSEASAASTFDPELMNKQDETCIAASVRTLQDGFSTDTVYTPGTELTIPLTELGMAESTYSTNASMNMYRVLRDLCHWSATGDEYLKSIQIIIHIINPDSPDMDAINAHNSSTAYTTGLTNDADGIINIYSIPVPDTQSLKAIIGHEIKHAFPVLATNVSKDNPALSGFSKNKFDAALEKYTRLLDEQEHIDKDVSPWAISGVAYPANLMIPAGFTWFPEGVR